MRYGLYLVLRAFCGLCPGSPCKETAGVVAGRLGIHNILVTLRAPLAV